MEIFKKKNNIDVIRAFIGEGIDGVTIENNFSNFQIYSWK